MLKPIIVMAFFFCSTGSFAQEVEKKFEGWRWDLKLGAALGWNVNQDFVGIVTGHYANLGGSFGTHLDYINGPHEWRTSLELVEMYSRTPVIPRFLKAADQLNFSTAYLYHILEWFGAFADTRFLTAVAPGEDVRATAVTYNITSPAGATRQETASFLALTTPFMPFVLSEQAGLFAKPVREHFANLEFRLAAKSNQIFAAGQRVVTDATDTAVSVKELINIYQIGPAAGMSFNGKAWEDRAFYGMNAEIMIPFGEWPAPTDGKTALERYNFELGAGAGVRLYEWASLEWQLKVLRIPAILDKYQVQSNLLLTISYALEKTLS